MSLYQLLLVACVAEVAGEIAHILWVIARGDRRISSKNRSGAGEVVKATLAKTTEVSVPPLPC